MFIKYIFIFEGSPQMKSNFAGQEAVQNLFKEAFLGPGYTAEILIRLQYDDNHLLTHENHCTFRKLKFSHIHLFYQG